ESPLAVTARGRRPIELLSLRDDLNSAGHGWHTDLLSFGVVTAAGSTARVLGIPEGAAVYAIERLRYARNVPVALMRHEVPAAIVSFTREDLEQRGLYEILRSHDAEPRATSETIGARAATVAEARILEEFPGAALLTMQRTAYDEHGRTVEHGQHVYRPSFCTFQVTLTSSEVPSRSQAPRR
ncbi:MAG: UTRA domain-containing protein, partial [Streptosporangiaceae bacterium]